MASGGALTFNLSQRELLHRTSYALVIREGVSADSSTKDFGRIRVFFGGAEVEHPVIVSVVVVQELLRVLSSIAVQTFYACGWVAHDYYAVRNIGQICTFKQGSGIA